MTDILKTSPVSVTASLIDTNARASFRGFGVKLGTADTPHLGQLHVHAFGDTVEVASHEAPGFMVEFHIKGLMGEAHRLLTLAKEGKLDEIDAHPLKGDLTAQEAANWTIAKWPGDAVRRVILTKGREIGDIRIQDYSDLHGATPYRVASFLPGRLVDNPGDTPKTEPDHSTWEKDAGEANIRFAMFLETAQAEGWVLRSSTKDG